MRTDSMPQLDVRNDGKRDRPFPPPRWAGHPPSVLDTPQTMSPSVAEQPRYTPMTQARTSSKSPDDYINSHSYTAPVRPPPSPPRVHATLGKEPFQDDTNIAMIKQIFRPLENYIATSMDDLDCLNSSFLLSRPSNPTRSSSEASVLTRRPKKVESYHGLDDTPFELDAKTLLLGDIGENGTWWAGERQAPKKKSLDESEAANPQGDRKHLRHDWSSIGQWYDLVFSCGRSWRAQSQFFSSEEKLILMDPIQALYIDETLAEARVHIQRSFFKMQENLLRRPGRLLKVPEECRFLLILLGNPLLYPYRGGGPLSPKSPHSEGEYAASMESTLMQPSGPNPRQLKSKEMSHRAGATGQHSGIIKRILGLIANLSNDCHQTFVSWFCRTPEAQFRELVDLVGGFVSYRLGRSQGRKTHANHDPTAGLIPHMSGPGAGTSAHLHAALRPSGRNPKKEPKDKTVVYEDEWQVKAAAKVMSLLFAANTSYGRSSRHELTRVTSDNPSSSMNLPPRPRAARHGQLLPTNTFYNTLLDYADLVADFETWESRKGKFSFCQYPIFLSIWAKIHIMEHDARRQMEFKARDAFFTSIMSNKAVSQYLLLKVRRDCLVDDSLRGVSEVVGTGQEEIKKGLRIEFVGEEGVDAGG